MKFYTLKFAKMILIFISQVIGNVELDGLKYRSKSIILNSLNLKTGQQFPAPFFRTYLYNLYIQGFLDTLIIYSNVRNDTIDFFIRTNDYPTIEGFKLEIKNVSKKEIEDSLNFYKGLPANDYNLEKIRFFIEKTYEKKGFVNPDIQIEEKRTDFSRVQLVIKGNIGSKYKISKIEIYGNKSIHTNILKNLMSNKEPNFIRRILRGGYFSKSKFDEDLKKIEEVYHDNGYPFMKIDSSKIIYEGENVRIRIFINEGDRIYFGNIQFEGNKKLNSDYLKNFLAIKKPLSYFQSLKYKFTYGLNYNPLLYSRARVIESISNISGVYSDSGYLYVQVEPVEERRDSFIDITFKIKENWKVKVRLVNIVGNYKTWDEIIRREIYIFPGDYFSRTLLMLSYRNLYYLNYFSNINVNFKPVPEDSSLVDLEFKVEEKATGQIGAGASYSQLYGLSFNVSLNQPNFLGRGWTASIIAEYGANIQNYQLSFTEPWFMGEPILVGFSTYSLTQYLYTFYQKNTGFSLSYGRRLWNIFSNLKFDYSLNLISVYNISSLYQGTPFYDFWNQHPNVLSSALTTTFSYDNRDRIFNPSKGFLFSLPYTINGGPIGGSLHFVKIMPEIQYLVPNYKDKLVSFFRLDWGSIFSILSSSPIPPSEYFALGDVGPMGLRGYDLRSIGTRVGNSVLGGRHFFRGTFEERIRPTDQFYLSLFYETGNAWWSIKTINPQLFSSIGIGFRIEVPMIGVMGFDFAYSLNYKQFKTHFNLGPNF